MKEVALIISFPPFQAIVYYCEKETKKREANSIQAARRQEWLVSQPTASLHSKPLKKGSEQMKGWDRRLPVWQHFSHRALMVPPAQEGVTRGNGACFC